MESENLKERIIIKSFKNYWIVLLKLRKIIYFQINLRFQNQNAMILFQINALLNGTEDSDKKKSTIKKLEKKD